MDVDQQNLHLAGIQADAPGGPLPGPPSGRGRELAVLDHEDWVDEVVFSPNGMRLVTHKSDDTAYLWDADSGEELAVLPHEGGVSEVVFGPDGTRLVTRTWGDRTARLWDANSGQLLAALRHEGLVGDIVFSSDGTRLATVSADGATRLWDADSGEELAVLPHEDELDTVIFSPDGTRLATVSSDGIACLWDACSGQEVAVLRHEGVDDVIFSPDGTRLAIGSPDGTARLVDAHSGEELAVLRHGGEVNEVNFSPDGMQLATGSQDGTARLVDAQSGQKLAVLRHEGWVYDVEFGPSGRRLVTRSQGIFGGEDATYLWRVYPEELAALACDIVGRNLTAEEWQQYLGDKPYRQTCPDLPMHPSVTRPLLDEGIELVQKGQVQEAVARFEEALDLDPNLEIDAETWGLFCWHGSLSGHAADVLFACNKAVALAPDEGVFHDGRGVARALTGDFEGAIEDFAFYVDWLMSIGFYFALGPEREAWIAELEAGRNPIDEEALETLRERMVE